MASLSPCRAERQHTNMVCFYLILLLTFTATFCNGCVPARRGKQFDLSKIESLRGVRKALTHELFFIM